jgi:hypothetical protein
MPGERRIVYILGAGASLGAGAYVTKQGGGRISIPTQTTFWDTFLRFCKDKKNRKAIERFLFSERRVGKGAKRRAHVVPEIHGDT